MDSKIAKYGNISKSKDETLTGHKEAKPLNHPDGSVTAEKLSDDVLELINANKFDGVIRYRDDNLDKLPTPENRVLIYKIDDNMTTTGVFNGMLVVSGLWGTATDLSGKDVPVVVRVDQTRISTRGEVYSRYGLNDKGELKWSEWKSPELILRSSTEGSNKEFVLTINDEGTINVRAIN